MRQREILSEVINAAMPLKDFSMDYKFKTEPPPQKGRRVDLTITQLTGFA